MNTKAREFGNKGKRKTSTRSQKHLSHNEKMDEKARQSSIPDINLTADPTMEFVHKNDSTDDLGRNEDLAQIEIGTLGVILIVTILGNGLVLLALYAKKCKAGKKTLSRMYFYIFHLCVADLITAFLNVLPQLFWDITYRFKGNQFLCKSVKYGQILGPYLSSYVLMATALDRYRAICYPLTYHSWSSRRSKTFVGFAWLISFVFSTPQLFIFSYVEIQAGTDVWDCWAAFPAAWGERAYVVWYSVSIFIVPLAGLIFTYTCICRVIWQNASTELGNQGQLISRAKINTIKQTIAVIAVYIVCSLPFITAQLWATFDPISSMAFTSGPLFTIVMLLSSLNSCANPWIFMVFNSDLFFSLRLLACGKQPLPPQSMRHSNSDSSNTVNASRRTKISKRCPPWRKPSLSDTETSINQDQFELKRWVAAVDENGTTTTEITTSHVPLEFR